MRALPIAVWMLVALLQLMAPARAGTVTITPIERGMIVVVADNATIDEVLARIGERFDFTVERVSSGGNTKTYSGRFAGTPDQLVTQMLRGQGHVVVWSTNAPAGIGRILLLGSPEPTAIASTPQLNPQPKVVVDPSNPVTPGKPSPSGSYGGGGSPADATHAGAPAADVGPGPALVARPQQVTP